jgi:hypothetical protein
MPKLQQAVLMCPQDQFLWTKKVRIEQSGMDTKGKNKRQRKEDKGQACTDAFYRLQIGG